MERDDRIITREDPIFITGAFTHVDK